MSWHRIELALGVALPLAAAAVASFYAHQHAVRHGRMERPALMRTIGAERTGTIVPADWQREAARAARGPALG